MTNRSSFSGLLTSICHCSLVICHFSFAWLRSSGWSGSFSSKTRVLPSSPVKCLELAYQVLCQPLFGSPEEENPGGQHRVGDFSGTREFAGRRQCGTGPEPRGHEVYDGAALSIRAWEHVPS